MFALSHHGMRACVLTASGLFSFEDQARGSARTVQAMTNSSTARLHAAYVLGNRVSRLNVGVHALTYQTLSAWRRTALPSRPSPPRIHAQQQRLPSLSVAFAAQTAAPAERIGTPRMDHFAALVSPSRARGCARTTQDVTALLAAHLRAS